MNPTKQAFRGAILDVLGMSAPHGVNKGGGADLAGGPPPVPVGGLGSSGALAVHCHSPLFFVRR